MDIFRCIKKLAPDWQGVVWGNSYEGIKPNELETRPIPALEELEAVWVEVQAEMLTEQKRQAYKTEADPLYAEWQALLSAGHEDAEAKRQEWIAKRAEIAARFE